MEKENKEKSAYDFVTVFALSGIIIMLLGMFLEYQFVFIAVGAIVGLYPLVSYYYNIWRENKKEQESESDLPLGVRRRYEFLLLGMVVLIVGYFTHGLIGVTAGNIISGIGVIMMFFPFIHAEYSTSK